MFDKNFVVGLQWVQEIIKNAIVCSRIFYCIVAIWECMSPATTPNYIGHVKFESVSFSAYCMHIILYLVMRFDVRILCITTFHY